MKKTITDDILKILAGLFVLWCIFSWLKYGGGGGCVEQDCQQIEYYR